MSIEADRLISRHFRNFSSLFREIIETAKREATSPDASEAVEQALDHVKAALGSIVDASKSDASDAIDEIISERDSLSGQVDELRSEKDELQSKIDELEEELRRYEREN